MTSTPSQIDLHPAIRAFLEATPRKPLDFLDTTRKRLLYTLTADATYLQFGQQPPETESVTIGRDEAPVRMRIYWPPGPRTDLPMHVVMHGGGWWGGSIDELVVDATCRERAVGAHCLVVAVDYRLAPEHRFPAALDDGMAALAWVVEHAGELGGNPQVLTVGGASAGGNLSAALALRARDENGPRIGFQLLEVPAVDLTAFLRVPAPDGGTDVGLDADDLEECLRHYLADPSQAEHPYASPLLADDLTGLPPSHVMTAEWDPLRDQAEAYAARLAAAGIRSTYTRYPGAVHGSILLTRTWPGAQQWRDEVLRTLRREHRRLADGEEAARR